MLEERVGDHGHERMTMESLPGSSLEVIETEFLFQLLMRLLYGFVILRLDRRDLVRSGSATRLQHQNERAFGSEALCRLATR
jgi:hypothetical protein